MKDQKEPNESTTTSDTDPFFENGQTEETLTNHGNDKGHEIGGDGDRDPGFVGEDAALHLQRPRG